MTLGQVHDAFRSGAGATGRPTVSVKAPCNRRCFARLAEGDGLPDGLTVDAEGFVWSACWGGWKVMRFSPEGRVDREIMLPAEFPSSCTFGGENLDTLYITTAREPLSEMESKNRPMDGRLFRVQTPCRGLPADLYQGNIP